MQRDSELCERIVYWADAEQQVHNEREANKGRDIKTGNDHKLVKRTRQKIGKENYSPDAVIGEIREKICSLRVSVKYNHV